MLSSSQHGYDHSYSVCMYGGKGLYNHVDCLSHILITAILITNALYKHMQ